MLFILINAVLIKHFIYVNYNIICKFSVAMLISKFLKLNFVLKYKL